MKVRFNRGALADLAAIIDYIAELNPQAAAKLSGQFDEAAKLIGFMPEIGASTSRQNFRRIVVGSHLMVYEIRSGEAIIHYIRHGARLRPWENESWRKFDSGNRDHERLIGKIPLPI
jgi:plasmid stabilization system protein ParE